jgi:hypothetical protein
MYLSNKSILLLQQNFFSAKFLSFLKLREKILGWQGPKTFYDLRSWLEKCLDIVRATLTRVTRLGEFLPNGRLFILRRYFEHYWSTAHFWLLFSRLSLCINFDKMWVGLHFGRFFSKTRLVALTLTLFY